MCESASPDSLTHGGCGCWLSGSAPAAQPAALEVITKDTREKTTKQTPGDKAKYSLPPLNIPSAGVVVNGASSALRSW